MEIELVHQVFCKIIIYLWNAIFSLYTRQWKNKLGLDSELLGEDGGSRCSGVEEVELPRRKKMVPRGTIALQRLCQYMKDVVMCE